MIFSRGVINQLEIAAIILGVTISTASAQDVAAGEISFSRCLGCHAVGMDARNKIGPELTGSKAANAGPSTVTSIRPPTRIAPSLGARPSLWSTSSYSGHSLSAVLRLFVRDLINECSDYAV